MNHALAVSAPIGSILDNDHVACLNIISGKFDQNLHEHPGQYHLSFLQRLTLENLPLLKDAVWYLFSRVKTLFKRFDLLSFSILQAYLNNLTKK